MRIFNKTCIILTFFIHPLLSDPTVTITPSTLTQEESESQKVYDCFLFTDELEALEIRLNELNSVVDKFILIEANETLSGDVKPFNFENNQDRYSSFQDKIIYVKIDGHYDTDSQIARETYQRNQMTNALDQLNCDFDDVVIISNADEIFSLSFVQSLDDITNHAFVVGGLDVYKTQVNRKTNEYNIGPIAALYYLLRSFTPQMMRNIRTSMPTYSAVGWQFSDLLNESDASYEVQAIDEKMPQYIRDNQSLFNGKGLIDNNIPK